MAEEFGLSPVWVFGAFSMAMVISAIVGPWAGARIDSVGGRGVLMLSNLVFAMGVGLLAAAPVNDKAKVGQRAAQNVATFGVG